ncbi:MAG TPA: tyrosine-type recombinase/integrase [Bacteroidota bacterium]|nr:tyrosine-type recombinase/integrase [Bacteroidota bacterium]
MALLQKNRPQINNRRAVYAWPTALCRARHNRHSFASWLVQSGATLYEVQRLLGHSSPTVTEIYSHLQPEHLHGTVNKISVKML